MSYTTPAAVRMAAKPNSNGIQTTNSHTAADLSDAQLTDFIAEADAVIDGYIGKYYAVPVALVLAGEDEDGSAVGTVPHPIDFWSRAIALYNATLSLMETLDFTDQDPIARRYLQAFNQLVAVSKGQANLQLPDNTAGPSGTGAGAPVNPYLGTLFGTEDFNLIPLNPAFPLLPTSPGRWGNW